MLPAPWDFDDVLTAFDEIAYRWPAYGRAVAAAGPHPDEETFFELLRLQFALDDWRERFVAALERRGIPLDYVLESVG